MLDHAPTEVIKAAIRALGQLSDPRAIPFILPLLENPANAIGAAMALAGLGDDRGSVFLRTALGSADQETRTSMVAKLARLRDDIDHRLLTCDVDASPPYLDPQAPITFSRIAEASRRLNLAEPEIRRRYEVLAPIFALTLEWQPSLAE